MVNLRRFDHEALVRPHQVNGAWTPVAVRPILRDASSFLASNHGLGAGIFEQHSGRVVGVGDLEDAHARRCGCSPELSQELGDAARSVPCAAARVSAAEHPRNGIVPALTRRSALVSITDRPVFVAVCRDANQHVLRWFVALPRRRKEGIPRSEAIANPAILKGFVRRSRKQRVFLSIRDRRSSMFSGVFAHEVQACRARGMGQSAGHSLSLRAENPGKTRDRAGRTVQGAGAAGIGPGGAR